MTDKKERKKESVPGRRTWKRENKDNHTSKKKREGGYETDDNKEIDTNNFP